MGTKTISITEEAYDVLKARKEANDSFSDVIMKSFPRHSLLELAGILSDKEAKDMKGHIKELRAKSRERFER